MSAQQKKLSEQAESQQGYFTTKQALSAGYSARSHVYHVQTGAWIKEYRGIFRLAHYPVSGDGQYVLWTLWSCNRGGEPQGVFSHQTALSMHDLSDVMPTKLHMTVPPGFRRNSALPVILCIHKANIPKSDVVQFQGFSTVRALRAIVDLLHDGTESRDLLRQALRQGLERGLITRAEFQEHPESAIMQDMLK